MNKKILLIEDDPDVRLGLNAQLRACGYSTAFAGDAMSAVAVARKEQPDLVLLDLGLPAGDGFVVMDRFRTNANLSHIPIVVVSARPAREFAQRSIDAGALAFLQKPVDGDQLLSTVASALQ